MRSDGAGHVVSPGSAVSPGFHQHHSSSALVSRRRADSSAAGTRRELFNTRQPVPRVLSSVFWHPALPSHACVSREPPGDPGIIPPYWCTPALTAQGSHELRGVPAGRAEAPDEHRRREVIAGPRGGARTPHRTQSMIFLIVNSRGDSRCLNIARSGGAGGRASTHRSQTPRAGCAREGSALRSPATRTRS